MKRQNQHLRTSKTYRLPPVLAHKIADIAKTNAITESEWVRQVLANATQHF